MHHNLYLGNINFADTNWELICGEQKEKEDRKIEIKNEIRMNVRVRNIKSYTWRYKELMICKW